MSYLTYLATTKSFYHKKTEDNYSVGDNYIIIADGMGGECNGDIASKIAVETILDTLKINLSDNLSEMEASMSLLSARFLPG